MHQTEPESHPQTLLILDDDALTGQTIRSIAEFSGLEVRFTTSPDTFFHEVDNWQPSLVAIDLIMPEMDGVAVMAQLAERGCRANLIITSGVGSRVLDAAVRSATEHGLNILGSLAKPFSPAELRTLLSRARPTQQRSSLSHSPVSPSGVTLADLQQALNQNELVVHYQPKIHCATGTLVGLEALVRWQHPKLGLLPPGRFIPLAESQGLIDELTEVVFKQALTWLNRVKTRGWPVDSGTKPLLMPAELTLSINISARSLNNFSLFERLATLCQQHRVPPVQVIFELTETSAMEDPTASLDLLTRLRVQGFELSIDDFGTGFSSMLQLVRLPFSEIKIDKSFVMTVNDSAESRVVVNSIVNLAKSLGIVATAEGIEDEATLDYLRNIGCQQAQGFYVAQPLDSPGLYRWYQSYSETRERRRLASLHQLNLLDSPTEARFDRITHLAMQLFRVPMALVSLVDEDRQWFKSHPGLEMSQTPRSESFCTYAIEGDDILVIENALEDHRVAQLPLVTGTSHIRFYAGYPLNAPDGSHVGTLCFLDTKPRSLGKHEHQMLSTLGEMTERALVFDPDSQSDALTGLLNRATFEREAENLLTLFQSSQHHATLLLMSLDNLRSLNLLDGRDEGDLALKKIARVLKESCGPLDLVGRYGGDDFVALLIDDASTEVDVALDRLCTNLGRYHQQATHSETLNVLCGIATTRKLNRFDLQSLVVEADMELQRLGSTIG